MLPWIETDAPSGALTQQHLTLQSQSVDSVERVYAFRPAIPPTPEEASEMLLEKLEQAGRVPSKDKFRRMACNTFIFTGACPYNDRCVFLHDYRIKAEGVKVRTTRQTRSSTAIKDTFYWPDMTRKDVIRNTDAQGLPSANQMYVVPEAFKANPTNFHNRGLYSLWAHFVEYCMHNAVFYVKRYRDLGSEPFFQTSAYKENPHVPGAKRLDVFVQLSLGLAMATKKHIETIPIADELKLASQLSTISLDYRTDASVLGPPGPSLLSQHASLARKTWPEAQFQQVLPTFRQQQGQGTVGEMADNNGTNSWDAVGSADAGCSFCSRGVDLLASASYDTDISLFPFATELFAHAKSSDTNRLLESPEDKLTFKKLKGGLDDREGSKQVYGRFSPVKADKLFSAGTSGNMLDGFDLSLDELITKEAEDEESNNAGSVNEENEESYDEPLTDTTKMGIWKDISMEASGSTLQPTFSSYRIAKPDDANSTKMSSSILAPDDRKRQSNDFDLSRPNFDSFSFVGEEKKAKSEDVYASSLNVIPPRLTVEETSSVMSNANSYNSDQGAYFTSNDSNLMGKIETHARHAVSVDSSRSTIVPTAPTLGGMAQNMNLSSYDSHQRGYSVQQPGIFGSFRAYDQQQQHESSAHFQQAWDGQSKDHSFDFAHANGAANKDSVQFQRPHGYKPENYFSTQANHQFQQPQKAANNFSFNPHAYPFEYQNHQVDALNVRNHESIGMESLDSYYPTYPPQQPHQQQPHQMYQPHHGQQMNKHYASRRHQSFRY